MTEGTRSVLFGSHNPLMHGYCVLKAWRHLYKCNPEPWELVCILVHDLGHIGLNYLSDPLQKNAHWVMGAVIARWLCGEKGFKLCAGHTNKSGYLLSALKLADKYSWVVAPLWWLHSNDRVEGLDRLRGTKVETFIKAMKEQCDNNDWRDCHDWLLEQRRLNESDHSRVT